jgi:DNA-directed RNA polymerase subunit omega
MERAHDTMMNPPIEDLLEEVDSKFGLVTLAARRARHINAYFNQLGEGLGHMVPPQVSSVSRKPLSIAFEEIAADKIIRTDAPEEPVGEGEIDLAALGGEMAGGDGDSAGAGA